MRTEKILVRAPNWLGDIIMARPAIATIRGHYPDATLTVAAPPAFAPLCAAIPGVDAVLPLPRGNSRSARRARADVIEAGSFDLAILLTNSFGTALDVWRAGVPERWGFRADWRARLLTRAIERPRRAKTRATRESVSSSGDTATPRTLAESAGRREDAPGWQPADANAMRAARDANVDAARTATAASAADVHQAAAAGSARAADARELRAVSESESAVRGGGEAEAPRRRHHSEYYLALTTALGMTPIRAVTPLRVADAARERARELLVQAGWNGATPLAAVAPGAAYGYAKRWPPDRFAAIIAQLATRGVQSVLVGAAADRESARAVESALAANAFIAGSAGRETQTQTRGGGTAGCLNLTGATDLPALMGLFGYCSVVLSNDSGAMHLASAVGRPVVAVFGPTDDVATAPLGPHRIVRRGVWCRPCLLRECPIDHRCMRGVTPDIVLDAIGAYAPFTS